MSTKLSVGNLPFDITEDDLRKMLSDHGPVDEIAVVMDKVSGRARGFAFATMNTAEAANAAILALNGKDFKGRALTVNEARPREERSGGGGGGGGYRGGGRSRY
jgi:RNA recognition motif-containing protein